MEQGFWRNLPPAMVAGFLLLVAMVVGSLLLAVRLADNAAETAQLVEYRTAINDTINAAVDAETGQRGYLLTGEDAYLQPYRAATTQYRSVLARLARDGDGRGAILARAVTPTLDAKMAEMQRTLDLAATGRRDAAIALVRTDMGRRTMDRVRSTIGRELDWARDRSTAIVQGSRRLVRQLTLGLIGGLIAMIVLALAWLSQSKAQLAEADRARGDAEAALAALRRENAGREEAEAQVRQLQKMESIGQLTGGIAHDFNNMLAVVIGGLELAKRRLRSDPDRAERSLDNAREGATRAATLTARLLAFSRRQPLAPTPLDPNRLVGGMSDLLTRTLGETISVETVLGAGIWRCYADASGLENAILNLAVNARDAMPGGGKLTIETANTHIDDRYAASRSEVEPGQYVNICVSDTGTGMPQDVIDRAFDPFFTTKDVGKGTGLGLSQVFGFVKQSGGHVAIYSEVGEGTTIKLYMPRFQGAEADDPASDIHRDTAPEGSPEEIILVVEDEQRVRHFAVDVLRELGYTTISAGSPAEALRAIEEQPTIALLFTDIVMPDMNGRRLADLARAARPDLKVLYTTGYTRNAVVHNGMVDIGVAFLPKPYTIVELARKIRDVLDGGGVNRRV